jgi:hypothetical protein
MTEEETRALREAKFVRGADPLARAAGSSIICDPLFSLRVLWQLGRALYRAYVLRDPAGMRKVIEAVLLITYPPIIYSQAACRRGRALSVAWHQAGRPPGCAPVAPAPPRLKPHAVPAGDPTAGAAAATCPLPARAVTRGRAVR